MPLIDKKRLPLVDLDFMNEVHLQEVDIINELSQMLDAYWGDEREIPAITDKLDELIRHTKTHFAGEERLMVEGRFPPYTMHKGEHDRHQDRLTIVRRNWDSTQDVHYLRSFIQRELPEWFAHHILTMDTVTAQYLAASGQMPGYGS